MGTPRIRTPGRSTARTLLHDPALFARVVLGANLWQTQREILTAVSQHSRVAVKASHASGKSYAIAIAALWWLNLVGDAPPNACASNCSPVATNFSKPTTPDPSPSTRSSPSRNASLGKPDGRNKPGSRHCRGPGTYKNILVILWG